MTGQHGLSDDIANILPPPETCETEKTRDQIGFSSISASDRLDMQDSLLWTNGSWYNSCVAGSTTCIGQWHAYPCFSRELEARCMATDQESQVIAWES